MEQSINQIDYRGKYSCFQFDSKQNPQNLLSKQKILIMDHCICIMKDSDSKTFAFNEGKYTNVPIFAPEVLTKDFVPLYGQSYSVPICHDTINNFQIQLD